MEKLVLKMMEFYSKHPAQIQHFMKVHGFAKLIGIEEQLDNSTQHILEVAAIVHDIGVKPAIKKYGVGSGRYQELEGPPVAEEMLRALGYPQNIVERVCYLVGHHHTYKDIDGIDYQILVEADFLVNMYEHNMSMDTMRSTLANIFRTKTGTQYCKIMFGIDL